MTIYENPKNEFEKEIYLLFISAKNKNYNVPMQFVALRNIYDELTEEKQKEYSDAFMIVYRSLAI